MFFVSQGKANSNKSGISFEGNSGYFFTRKNIPKNIFNSIPVKIFILSGKAYVKREISFWVRVPDIIKDIKAFISNKFHCFCYVQNSTPVLFL